MNPQKELQGDERVREERRGKRVKEVKMDQGSTGKKRER